MATTIMISTRVKPDLLFVLICITLLSVFLFHGVNIAEGGLLLLLLRLFTDCLLQPRSHNLASAMPPSTFETFSIGFESNWRWNSTADAPQAAQEQVLVAVHAFVLDFNNRCWRAVVSNCANYCNRQVAISRFDCLGLRHHCLGVGSNPYKSSPDAAGSLCFFFDCVQQSLADRILCPSPAH